MKRTLAGFAAGFIITAGTLALALRNILHRHGI
jgi:hypothetical protein